MDCKNYTQNTGDNNYNNSECDHMIKTKYIYIYRNIYSLENRVSLSVGDKVLWSNKTVAKKVTEYQA